MSRPHKIQKSISYALFFASVIVNIQDFTILFLSIVTNSYICDDVILNWSSCKYVFISSNLGTLVTAGNINCYVNSNGHIKLTRVRSHFFDQIVYLLRYFMIYMHRREILRHSGFTLCQSQATVASHSPKPGKGGGKCNDLILK